MSTEELYKRLDPAFDLFFDEYRDKACIEHHEVLIGEDDEAPPGGYLTGDWNVVSNSLRFGFVNGVPAYTEVDNPQFDEDESWRLDDFFDLLWLDEYEECHRCSGLVRTSPDSYMWTPQYADYQEGDGDLERVCVDCVTEDLDEYIAHSVNQGNRIAHLLKDSDLAAAGFVRLQECNRGFYESNTNHDPARIVATLVSHGLDVLFSDLEPSQFESRWSVYVRPRNGGELSELELSSFRDLINDHNAPGAVANNMKKALSEVSLQTKSRPDGPLVLSIKVDEDGYTVEEGKLS